MATLEEEKKLKDPTVFGKSSPSFLLENNMLSRL
jgi:hypothetical protein